MSFWNEVEMKSSRAHVAKFYRRLRLICSVWRASTFSVFKIDWNCNSWVYYTIFFGSVLYLGTFGGINFQLFVNYFVWPRITDEGSVPEMCIWSILLIKSALKWFIHLSRSLFLIKNWMLILVLLCENECQRWDASRYIKARIPTLRY